jgi:hypothetical protein
VTVISVVGFDPVWEPDHREPINIEAVTTSLRGKLIRSFGEVSFGCNKLRLLTTAAFYRPLAKVMLAL